MFSTSDRTDAVIDADSQGFNGGKLINGRKQHVVVDTVGLLLGVMVTAADTGDHTAAQVLLGQVTDVHHRLELLWADGGYTGSLVEHCLATLALVLAIVKGSDDMRGFVVLPNRWIVERLFAHLTAQRATSAHPARVRRGFRHLRVKTTRPASVPRPSKPGPGHPPGSKNRRSPPRHEPGKTVKRIETLTEHVRLKQQRG
ncbi:transposase [Streptomyces camelliae]|uniref:Transposase n=1 Tax=Streptomyces camelliae TaxID=3004093 RepID=A0ABY7NTL3_9ACTN|nr:transposase [Streptomyces sp. HUAS 2-6]WBO61583.1 transposase [Streptomyces sp. HUAS 2-6]